MSWTKLGRAGLLGCLALMTACGGGTSDSLGAGPLGAILPTESFTCIPLSYGPEYIWAGTFVTNEGDDTVRFVDVMLQHPANVELVESFAWPTDSMVSLIPIGDLDEAEGAESAWSKRVDLEGFELQPGESVAVGLRLLVQDLKADAALWQAALEYDSEGSQYLQTTGIALGFMRDATCENFSDRIKELTGQG